MKEGTRYTGMDRSNSRKERKSHLKKEIKKNDSTKMQEATQDKCEMGIERPNSRIKMHRIIIASLDLDICVHIYI